MNKYITYDYWKRKQYYNWEVNDFYEVSQKLRQLAEQIPERLTIEDLEYYLMESDIIQQINERLNKKVRVLARENRKLNKIVNKLIQQVNFLEEIIRKQYKPKDALIW
jgi:signal recognition particle GTPase